MSGWSSPNEASPKAISYSWGLMMRTVQSDSAPPRACKPSSIASRLPSMSVSSNNTRNDSPASMIELPLTSNAETELALDRTLRVDERLVRRRDRELLDFVAVVVQGHRGVASEQVVGEDAVGQGDPLDFVGEVPGVDVRVGHWKAGVVVDDRIAQRVEHVVVPGPRDDEVAVVVDRQRLAGDRGLVDRVKLVDQDVLDAGRRHAQQLPLFQRVDQQPAVAPLGYASAGLAAREPIAHGPNGGCESMKSRQLEKRHLFLSSS